MNEEQLTSNPAGQELRSTDRPMYGAAAINWTPLQASQNSNIPLERYWHTATLGEDMKTVYVFGGMNVSGAVNDFWSQNWSNRTLEGEKIPVSRAYHSSVTRDKVVICGGQDGAAQPFQTYISAGGDTADMTAVLDTALWQWKIPDPSPFQPFPRSFASAASVNDSKMVIGFGINYHTIYDGIYVFDALQGNWVPTGDSSNETGTSLAFICGMSAVLAFLVAAALTGGYFAFKKLQTAFYQCTKRMRSDVWNPRPGEPAWAEISRLIFRVTFLAMFLTIIAVLVLQVRNSPIIDQKYYVHNDHYTVDVPDFGDSCSEYLIDISKNVETGLNYYGTALRCYLFRAPPTFRLGRTNDRVISNGSYLKFYYYGDRLPSNISHLHLVFYNKYHNPNLPVYHISDPYALPFSWYSESEDAQFQSAEEENLRTENSFDLNPNVGSTSSFAIIEREEIKSTYFWNYIGITTVHKRTYEIESKAVSETVTTVYATEPQPLGSLHVFPASYEVTVLREQRAFTLVNAMGIIGGIFGLILGLQTCLFGYRPRSPWGVIHRWSMGQMRRSLLYNLKSRFPENINVPIIHPLHRRLESALGFTDASTHAMVLGAGRKEARDDDGRDDSAGSVQGRMNQLEERLHVFELLFQAYYINDEVFRSLDHALQLDGTLPTVEQQRHGWRNFLISRRRLHS
ncbi:hypothetical protein DM01DRAFT_339473 [Hesseltinella vesiculosa]|uniref:Galactose oxidase n=1 Tax=Hesseltinella vesiculosa TaxID=101127 RepID=A0A1X2G2Z0_9FUNG|nr:hypothetical protein DM01DRAFT_339473 [Hesseltinella vesiculosa]